MGNRGSKSKIRFPILIPLMMKRDPTRQAASWPLPTPLGPSKMKSIQTITINQKIFEQAAPPTTETPAAPGLHA
jgi:hypothetical protein